MANVKSYSRHPEDLDDGSFISPGETRNIDVSTPRNADLVAQGKLVIVGADVAPTYQPIPPKGANRGAFQALTAYQKNDIVSQAGALYQAKTDFVAGASFSASDWTLLSAESSGPATLTYNADGTLASATTPQGTIASVTYDSQGRIATFVENGTTRTLTYDASTGALTGVS